jgi:hypothetical protein
MALIGWVRAPRFKLALLRSTVSWWLSKPQRSGNPITHLLAALSSRLDRYGALVNQSWLGPLP